MAGLNRKSTDLTQSDQERLQRIIDHVKDNSGAEIDFPKAIRVAMNAWEQKHVPELTNTPNEA